MQQNISNIALKLILIHINIHLQGLVQIPGSGLSWAPLAHGFYFFHSTPCAAVCISEDISHVLFCPVSSHCWAHSLMWPCLVPQAPVWEHSAKWMSESMSAWMNASFTFRIVLWCVLYEAFLDSIPLSQPFGCCPRRTSHSERSAVDTVLARKCRWETAHTNPGPGEGSPGRGSHS